jgi:hypothetical protein
MQIEPLTTDQYVFGGVVGTVVGFGIGHAIVGEYHTMGWVFTMTQVLSLSIPIFAAIVMGIRYWEGSAGATVDHLITAWGVCLWIGIALWAAFRVWEIVDLWLRPHHRLAIPQGIQTQPLVLPPFPPHTSFLITPLIMPQGGIGLGVISRW